MPEKISIKQMREWLEMKESGRTEAAIAHKFRRDVRTIKSGIERAVRERSAETVRTHMMMDAARHHQETLLDIVRGIAPGLEVGIERFASLKSYSNVSELAILPGETTPHWELLKQHLPRDPLWDMVGKWKKAIIDLASGCVELRGKTDHLLTEKCGCAIVDSGGRPPFLFSRTPELIYTEVLHLATDNRTRTDTCDSLQVDMKSGQVMIPNTILAVAPGREEEFAGYIRECWNEINESDEAAVLTGKYKDMLNAKEKARKAAEDITLLGILPGLCRICRRLGL